MGYVLQFGKVACKRVHYYYSNCNSAPVPELPLYSVSGGIICAAESEGQWYRAQVVQVYPHQDECDIKYVDYGGYTCVPINSLKQIRSVQQVLICGKCGCLQMMIMLLSFSLVSVAV